MNPKSQRKRLGLYRRVSLLAIIAVSLLVTGFSAATFHITRTILLDRQEENFVQTVSNQLNHVEEFYLRAKAEGVSSESLLHAMRHFVSSLSSGPEFQVILRYGGDTWVARNPVDLGRLDLNPSLLDAVAQGASPIMRYNADGVALQVIGTQLADGDLWYFGVGRIQNTINTLNSLIVIITVGSAIVLLTALLTASFLLRRTFASIKAFVRAAEDLKEGSLAPIRQTVDPEFDQLKDSFNQMQQIISQRLEREQQFALEVSHELKSPLTTIVLSMESLKLFQQELPAQAQHAIDLLALEVDRFRRLLLDLLEMSKPDEGLALEFSTIDAKHFLSNLVPHYVPCKIQGADMRFEAEATLLSQVFANLLENAQEYAGGVVAVEVWTEGKDIYFAIEDRGPGVPEYDREKIFERFARGTSGLKQGKGSGTGLGLAIAKERMQQQNGDIWVEDARGDIGARFVLKLPLVQPRYKNYQLFRNANRLVKT